ncbi:MAG: hypothetical protein U0796_06785 [Gemmatales bacterium]
MQHNRPTLWFPFILAWLGLFIWLATLYFHITLDGAHFIIPGYKITPEHADTPNHWSFFALSGVLFLAIVGLLNGSLRPVKQQNSAFSSFLVASAIVVTVVLLGHFFFTVCT